VSRERTVSSATSVMATPLPALTGVPFTSAMPRTTCSQPCRPGAKLCVALSALKRFTWRTRSRGEGMTHLLLYAAQMSWSSAFIFSLAGASSWRTRSREMPNLLASSLRVVPVPSR
jgi:hypothetical protein